MHFHLLMIILLLLIIFNIHIIIIVIIIIVIIIIIIIIIVTIFQYFAILDSYINSGICRCFCNINGNILIYFNLHSLLANTIVRRLLFRSSS